MEESARGSIRVEDFGLGRKSVEQWGRRREIKNTVECGTDRGTMYRFTTIFNETV